MIKSRYYKKKMAKPLTIEEKAYDEFATLIPVKYSLKIVKDGNYLEFRTIGDHAAQLLTEILPVRYDGLDVIIVCEEPEG